MQGISSKKRFYKRITTDTTTTLIKKETGGGGLKGDIRSITITNIDSLPAVGIEVFIEDEFTAVTTNALNRKYYFIKGIDIPVGVALVLKDVDIPLKFNSRFFHLRMKTNHASDGTDPILNVIIE
tara:strand:- start:313 stop:687 length:375 start_codon:yes stop_codon:yes gene_type:complete